MRWEILPLRCAVWPRLRSWSLPRTEPFWPLGGPGNGYDWPNSNHGIIDYKGFVWIGGNGRGPQAVLRRAALRMKAPRRRTRRTTTT